MVRMRRSDSEYLLWTLCMMYHILRAARPPAAAAAPPGPALPPSPERCRGGVGRGAADTGGGRSSVRSWSGRSATSSRNPGPEPAQIPQGRWRRKSPPLPGSERRTRSRMRRRFLTSLRYPLRQSARGAPLSSAFLSVPPSRSEFLQSPGAGPRNPRPQPALRQSSLPVFAQRVPGAPVGGFGGAGRRWAAAVGGAGGGSSGGGAP